MQDILALPYKPHRRRMHSTALKKPNYRSAPSAPPGLPGSQDDGSIPTGRVIASPYLHWPSNRRSTEFPFCITKQPSNPCLAAESNLLPLQHTCVLRRSTHHEPLTPIPALHLLPLQQTQAGGHDINCQPFSLARLHQHSAKKWHCSLVKLYPAALYYYEYFVTASPEGTQ